MCHQFQLVLAGKNRPGCLGSVNVEAQRGKNAYRSAAAELATSAQADLEFDWPCQWILVAQKPRHIPVLGSFPHDLVERGLERHVSNVVCGKQRAETAFCICS